MRKTIAVIGEGITEKYYIQSIKGMSPFTVLPNSLNQRASSLKDLQKAIDKAVADGFDEVYCLIDMDDKSEGKSKQDYETFKLKYHDKTIEKKKKGVLCKVVFIETERCTELWFLYHFTKSAITRKFNSYDELERELKKHRPNYEKKDAYFKSIGSLHHEMTVKRAPQGSLANATRNARASIKSKEADERLHTYSEMHKLFEALGISE